MIDGISNRLGEFIDSTFQRGNHGRDQSDWIVVLGHGVTGNKDRPVITDTASALNAAGFDSLRFSFSGNGESEGRFGDSHISKEVDDLGCVLDVVSKQYSRICYIGHSMGAAVGVIRAAGDKRIHALISIAGMVDTKAFAETEFGDQIPEEGFMWDEESCPLSSDFMRDLCETIGDVKACADQVNVPWLLIHGLADDVVLPSDTKCIERAKGDRVDVVYIEGSDHSFDEPDHKKGLLDAVIPWLGKLDTQI